MRRDFPNLKLIGTDSEYEAFGMVSNRKADMTLRSRIVAGQNIKEKGWFNLKIASEVPGYENVLRMGVLKSLPALRDQLNGGIATITRAERERIINRYVEIKMVTDVQIDYTPAIWLGVVLVAVIVTSLWWMRRLNALNRRLEQLSVTDALTGLFNRTGLSASLPLDIERAQRYRRSLSVVLLDLDHFKQVNDTQGHAAGDTLLRVVAQRLGECVRAQDCIGRLSGDEFVLLLSNCTTEQAVQTAQRVLGSIAMPVDIQGQINLPSASVGISIYPYDGTDIDTLVRHADQAMYQAKSDHRHSLQLFSQEMNRRAQERAAMERALHHALERGELTLHYQPQITSDPVLALHGMEALARWSHPEWGPVSPAQFIPLAEEAGLIPALTHWLVNEVCQQINTWRAAGIAVPHVAVNLSGRSFHQKGFAQNVSNTLRQHGLAAHDLLLEITESVMMDAREVTQENIELLSQQGFRLSLDDFGTGYSSLSYLHRLPITELKLDKSFVQDLEHSETARALTISVLSIAKSLGMTVVAEGVETSQQCRWLKEHGCEVMQGYLLGRPMPAHMLHAWSLEASAVCCS